MLNLVLMAFIFIPPAVFADAVFAEPFKSEILHCQPIVMADCAADNLTLDEQYAIHRQNPRVWIV